MTVMDQAAPVRSLQQRLSALEHANAIRTYRAALKRDLKVGHLHIRSVLSEPDPMLETMKVLDLLVAVPKVGRVKAMQLLSTCRASPSKTVLGLSERQRGELLLALWLRERSRPRVMAGTAKM